MKNQLVHDLPLRLFHWIIAALFVSAFWIAKTTDDDSSVFAYHMLAGFLLVLAVSLRILWGFLGEKHSRFSSFALHPNDLVSYFKQFLSGEKQKWTGHNPASSWAALAMFTFAFGLGITGYLMTTGNKETFEDAHELFANGFLAVVILHIAGVVTHSLRHRDNLAFSMINGTKSEMADTDSIPNSRPIAALGFLAIITAFSLYLVRNFNQQQQSLILFGSTLQLGENETDESESSEKSHDDEEHEDDDD